MKRKVNHKRIKHKSKSEPLSPLGFRTNKKLNRKKIMVFIVGLPVWIILGLVKVLVEVLRFVWKHKIIFGIVLCVILFIASLSFFGYKLYDISNKLDQSIKDNSSQVESITNSIQELQQKYLEQETQLEEKEKQIKEQETEIKNLKNKNEQLQRVSVTSRSGTTRTVSSRSNTSPATSGSKADLQSYAKSYMLATYGWGDDQFQSLVNLWNRESGWNPNAHNSSSGAHGIPQALPASKMASAGSDYYTNGETQIRWGLSYIKGRYGSPNSAWSFFQSHNWY